VPELWIPLQEGPHEAFVERLYRAISSFAEERGVGSPLVELELSDGSRFKLDRMQAEPGFGMVTVHVHPAHGSDAPEALVIPIGSIRRIELRSSPDAQANRFGFSLPAPDAAGL
jgi:hypothetical protein